MSIRTKQISQQDFFSSINLTPFLWGEIDNFWQDFFQMPAFLSSDIFCPLVPPLARFLKFKGRRKSTLLIWSYVLKSVKIYQLRPTSRYYVQNCCTLDIKCEDGWHLFKFLRGRCTGYWQLHLDMICLILLYFASLGHLHSRSQCSCIFRKYLKLMWLVLAYISTSWMDTCYVEVIIFGPFSRSCDRGRPYVQQ